MSTDIVDLRGTHRDPAAQAPHVRRLTPRSAFAAFLLGTFLAQLAWIITLPPFGGIDEIEHAYKAASVAHGAVEPIGPALHGRGELVAVPEDIVDAAHPVCVSLKYNERDNCRAVDHLDGGQVTVASAAARYNPLYYAVIGTMARPFHGNAAGYAMRVTTSVLCALLIGWSAALITRHSRTRWPLMGLIVATTPVLVYSTAIISPNGISYAAGLLVWAAVFGLVRDDVSGRLTTLLTALAVGSVTLALTHTTGPLWLALILFVGLLLRPAREWWRLAVTHRAGVLATAAVVGAGTIASVAWTSMSGANSLATDLPQQGPLRVGELVTNQALWVLQSIAVFPLRNEPAPMIVYVLWLVPMLAALVLALTLGTTRARVAVLLLVALDFGVPSVLTVISYPYLGLAWQGRYGLPLTVGLFLIGGLVLDRRGVQGRGALPVLLGGLTAPAMAISVAHVLSSRSHDGIAEPAAVGLAGGMAIVVVLALLGAALPVLAVARHGTPGASGRARGADLTGGTT